MPKLSPDAAAKKWASRTTAAVEDWRKGIEGVSESPTAKAALHLDKLLANIMESINSGRMAAALNNVSLADWKTASTTKGPGRIPAGVQGAVGKQEAYYRKVFPFLQTVQDEIASMPNMTIEDSIARAAHLMRRMNEFKRSGG